MKRNCTVFAGTSKSGRRSTTNPSRGPGSGSYVFARNGRPEHRRSANSFIIRARFSMHRRAFLGITLALPLAAQAPQSPTPAANQRPEASQAPSIKVQVNEVIVPVTVTDDKGRFVNDLEQKDFQIFDEGKPQKIQFFTRERSQPVVVGFLIDVSNASRLHWKNYQDAAIEMVQNLVPGDNPKFSGYLIGYSNDAELLVNTTTDPEPMVESLEKLKPSGGAALYDAIYMACTSRNLVQGEPIEPRRVLVIVGDGQENAGRSAGDCATESGDNLRSQHGCVRVFERGRQEPGATGRRDGWARGVSAGRRLFGRFRLSVYAIGRRQLCVPGRHGRIRIGARQRHVQVGGSGGRRSHHAVHHSLYSGHGGREKTVPEHHGQGRSGEREGTG